MTTHPVFSGRHYDIGVQLGVFYRRNGADWPAPEDTAETLSQIGFYERNAPGILEEIKGIADGGDYGFIAVATHFLTSEIALMRRMDPRKNCTIGGIRGEDGKLWIARTYDWRPDIADAYRIALLRPDGAAPVLAISDMSGMEAPDAPLSRHTFLPHDAFNDKGLYIGLTFSPCYETGIGLTSSDALRLAAQECETVDRAIAFFEARPLAAAKSFFVADAQGDMAVIHAIPGRPPLVRQPDERGLLALANRLPETLKDQENILPTLRENSKRREETLCAGLSKTRDGKALSLETVHRHIVNEEGGVCQCAYIEAIDRHVATAWAFALDQAAGEILFTDGPYTPHRTDHRFHAASAFELPPGPGPAAPLRPESFFGALQKAS